MRYLILCLILVLSGCGEKENLYSIADVEAAGFKKDQQQLYQLVEASDGWGGVIQGFIVEVYIYDSVNFDSKHFSGVADTGNASGWAESCRISNLQIISKGESVCSFLKMRLSK